MRIVHVVNHFLADYGYQEHFLAKAMAELGHEVHVIASNRAYPDHGVYKIFSEKYPARILPLRTYERAGYTVHLLNGAFEKNLQLLLRGLFGRLKAINPDLVIMHNFSRYETMRLAAYRRLFKPQWRLIVDDHSLFEFYDPRPFRKFYYSLLKFFYHGLGMHKGIDALVPVAAECAAFLEQVFRLPIGKMRVIPLGVDCDLFQFSETGRRQVREEFGISPGEFLLSYVGKVVPERGLLELLEWMLPLLKSQPAFRILIMGPGVNSAYGEKLREFSVIHGIAEKVHWRAAVAQDELPKFFSAADAAIWPRQETIAAYEAAACRLPLVLSKNLISMERTSAGNGFNCGSPQEYRAAVLQLINDPESRKQMADKGESYVRDFLSWRRLAAEFLRV